MKKNQLPFQNMSRESWINLAIAATIILYIIQIGFFIFDGTICRNYAFDFCAFWSAGRVSNELSLVEVYDISLLKEYQKEIYLYEHNEYTIFYGCPVPYLPTFLIPFKFLSILNLPSSFIFWTLFNLLVLIIYLWFFTKQTFRSPLSWRFILLLLLSLPVFVNFLEGQVNVFLVVFAGEFLRALFEGKTIKAGLWLGGWLLKPQLLILIIPILLFRKSIKVLLGFFVSSVIVLLTSFSLININGFFSLKNLLFEYSQGIPSNNIAVMMNWRMLGFHISSISSSTLGWGITIIGTVITTGCTLFFFRKWDSTDPTKTVIEMLGIFASTCAVTWHAHLHMSMILIPPLVYLMIKNKFSKNLFTAWVFVPILFQLIVIIIAYFLELSNLFEKSFQVFALSRGLPGFILNLLLFGWAIKNIKSKVNEAPGSQLNLNENTATS